MNVCQAGDMPMSEQTNRIPVANIIHDYNEPDDNEPIPKRQDELRAAYKNNVAIGRPPYAGVAIRTRGELIWVMNERRWHEVDPDGDIATANLSGADLRRANLSEIRLEAATLRGTLFGYANLDGALLCMADLSMASLRGANLGGADLRDTTLSGADLREAHMDANTKLTDALLDSRTRLVDVVWNGAPVTRLNWQELDMLGDETEARDPQGKRPDRFFDHQYVRAIKAVVRRSNRRPNLKRSSHNAARTTRLLAHEDGVLANRQVVSELRGQGINEQADRFAYRAQCLQRIVLWQQGHYLRSFGSWLLWLIAGYGYRPWRSFISYIAIVLAFMGAYLLNAQFASPHLTWDEALVLSVSAFHGRGFFTSGISLGDTLARLAAGEAIIGLLIEITFIATFTQRFFAR
jgi:Pentapeptide repeats (8 copies)